MFCFVAVAQLVRQPSMNPRVSGSVPGKKNCMLYLLKLQCDHGESSKDAFCRSCDGDYSLRR